MTKEQKDLLHTAMMLLEMGWDEESAKVGTPEEFSAAAHSYIQVAVLGCEHHSRADELVAKVWAAVAIADAQERAPREGTAGEEE
jgi:hypothetical protein